MSYYYGLRGWLEIPIERFRVVVSHLEQLQAMADDATQGYLEAWHPAYTKVNTTTYLFYGADVRAEGVNLLLSVVQSVIDLAVWDEDLTVDGYFHAQSEDNQRNYSIKIVDNEVTVEPDVFLLYGGDEPVA